MNAIFSSIQQDTRPTKTYCALFYFNWCRRCKRLWGEKLQWKRRMSGWRHQWLLLFLQQWIFGQGLSILRYSGLLPYQHFEFSGHDDEPWCLGPNFVFRHLQCFVLIQYFLPSKKCWFFFAHFSCRNFLKIKGTDMHQYFFGGIFSIIVVAVAPRTLKTQDRVWQPSHIQRHSLQLQTASVKMVHLIWDFRR